MNKTKEDSDDEFDEDSDGTPLTTPLLPLSLSLPFPSFCYPLPSPLPLISLPFNSNKSSDEGADDDPILETASFTTQGINRVKVSLYPPFTTLLPLSLFFSNHVILHLFLSPLPPSSLPPSSLFLLPSPSPLTFSC